MSIPELRAAQGPWNSKVQFLLRDGTSTAEPIVMKQREEGRVSEPSFSLSLSAAQVLMDDLWQCGLRPSEGSGSAGALAATQRHLDDMRRLVFSPPAVTVVPAK